MQVLDLERVQHALVLALGERIDEQVAEGADRAVLAGHRLLERASGPLGRHQVVDLARASGRCGRELAVRGLRPDSPSASPCASRSRARLRRRGRRAPRAGSARPPALHRLRGPTRTRRPRTARRVRGRSPGARAGGRPRPLAAARPAARDGAVGPRGGGDQRHEGLDELAAGRGIARLGREDELALDGLGQHRAPPEAEVAVRRRAGRRLCGPSSRASSRSSRRPAGPPRAGRRRPAARRPTRGWRMWAGALRRRPSPARAARCRCRS